MARISTYPSDTNVIGQDKWIGSDANNDLITKNFTANAVAAYFNKSAIIDTGQSAWSFIPYSDTQPQPEKTFMKVDWLNNSININNLAGVLRISALTLGNTTPGAFIENEWVGNNILVHLPGAPSAYSIYNVESLVPDGDWYYLMTISFVSGESRTIQENDSVVMGYFAGANVITEITGTFPIIVTEGAEPDVSIDASTLTNWNRAYNDSIVSAEVTGTATKTLTLNQQDGGTIQASWSDADTGLTSVGLSMPPAFSVANSPLTSNGTITITGAGTTLQYVDGTGVLQTFPELTEFVPYTGATTNVDLGVYSLTASALIKLGGTSSQFLKADGTVDSTSYQPFITAGTTSQYYRGDKTFQTLDTTIVPEGTNLYYLDSRARSALSFTAGSGAYNSTTGVITIPTNTNQLTNGASFITLSSLSASSPLSYNDLTGAFSISQSSASADGYLSSVDWITFNNKQIAGDYITSLTGEATGTGPGATAVTLNNASVTGKVLTGVNITGGTVLATDTMLTAFGKLQNQINGLVGSTIYQGVWNASTNTPTLTSSVGTNGFYYIVNVAGSTNLDGITDWLVGDWAIFNGGVWQKVDNTESVTSVNGFTGAVSLTTDNVAEGTTNLYFANSLARAAISLTTTGSSGAATYNNTTGVFNIPNYAPDLSGYVPYTGATGNVDLGTFDLTADVITGATGSFTSSGSGNTLSINHSSGSGIALNIEKAGNGEGLYINKTSGSGNAATIVGTLNATTLVKSGGTSSQFLKADGSVDSSVYALDSAVVKLTGTQTITGLKNFNAGITANVSTGGTQGFYSTNTSASGASINLENDSVAGIGMIVNISTSADGILIGNDTSGRGIVISNSTLSGAGTGLFIDNYNNGVGIEVQSSSAQDAAYFAHSSGRALRIFSSGTGYGLIINNATAATSVPFTIQKQGASVITFTDAGAGSFSSTITANGATLTSALSGTSATFSALTVENNQNGSTWVISKNTNAGAGAAAGFLMTNNTGDLGAISLLSSGNSPANGLFIRTLSTNSLILGTNNTANLTLASTGAATFSSSVTATSFISDGATSEGVIKIERDTVGTNTVIGSLIFTNNNGATTYGKVFGGRNSAGDGYVALGTGVSNNLYALESGNVGIGTTAPGAVLEVAGTSANTDFRISRTVSSSTYFYIKAPGGSPSASNIGINGTDVMTLNSSGSVGIGTTAPSKRLDVFTTATLATEYQLSLRNGAGANNVSTGIAFGFNTSSLDPDYLSAISSIVTNRSTRAADLTFLTAATGTLTERMRITSDGLLQFSTTSVVPTTNNIIHSYGANGFMYIQGGSTGLALAGSGNRNNAIYVNSSSNIITFVADNAERMRITSGGNVGIGTTSPSQKLAVVGDVRGYKLIGGEAGVGAGNYTIFSNDDNVGYIDTVRAVNSGDFHFRFDGTSRANINRSTGTYTATSDLRLKTNILDSQNVLSVIDKIKVRSYNWIENNSYEPYGLIAQELHEILPEYVYKPKNEGESWGLSKAELVPMLVKAVQELKAELDSIKQK